MFLVDMLLVLKCWVVNFVVKYVKKMVFLYSFFGVKLFMLVLKVGEKLIYNCLEINNEDFVFF